MVLPAEPGGRKAKLPRVGPGAPGLCKPLYRLLCRNSKAGKLRLDVTTCLLPSSLPLPPPSSSNSLPSHRCAQSPSGTNQARGQVWPPPISRQVQGWGCLARKVARREDGVSQAWREAKTQEERAVMSLMETRARVPHALLPSPHSIPHAPNAHPGVESEAGGCGQTGPPPARQGHSLKWRVGPGMTALRPTLRGPRAVDRDGVGGE